MRKEPSEISKWLSGTHNFTTNTLVDIGLALDIEFLQTEKQLTNEYTYVSMVIVAAPPANYTNRQFSGRRPVGSTSPIPVRFVN